MDFARITEAVPDDDTCEQHYHSSLSLNYGNIKDYSFSLINSDLSSKNEKPASMPDENIERRGYIDAWSAKKAATLTSGNNFSSLDLPHSGLSLSMSNNRTDLGIANHFLAIQSPVI
jgi:hypothetical protein